MSFNDKKTVVLEENDIVQDQQNIFVEKKDGVENKESDNFEANKDILTIEDHTNLTINMLKLYKKKWTINVCILRTFVDTFKNGKGKMQKLFCIDKEGTFIQGIMFNNLIDKFKGLLQRGKTYTITNGEVKLPNRKYPTLNSNKELVLTSETMIQESSHAVTLEILKKNFVSFEEASKMDDGIQIFNIFGILATAKPLYTGGTFKTRQLTIMNQEFEQLSVTLWNDLAEQEGSRLEELSNAKPIVVLLNVTGNKATGDFIVSSKALTIVLIDPNIEEVKTIRQWLTTSSVECDKSILQTPTKRLQNSNRVNLHDIINVSPLLSKSPYCSFVAKIISILNPEEPFFEACSRCGKAVHSNEVGIANCSQCDEVETKITIRFRLRLEVTDETENAYVTLFEEARTLFGCSAIDYVSAFEDDDSECYKKLMSCVDKEYIFLLKLTEKEAENRKARCLVAQEVRRYENVYPPSINLEEDKNSKLSESKKRLASLKDKIKQKKIKLEFEDLSD